MRSLAPFRAVKVRDLVAAGMIMVVVGATLVGVRPPAAGAATPGLAVGVVGDITWGISQADVDRTVASMADAGVTWVRANMNWAGGEPDVKGVLNEGWLAQVDYAVKRAQAAGISVLMPISDGVPYWASADPAKHRDTAGAHWNRYWRPTKDADYADFVRAVVSRYSRLGVHAYEVWNEPNLARFWPSGVSATDYTKLLSSAYPAIKAADPTATVVLGGLSKNDYVYLGQLYAAGARGYFDVAAVHPYTGDPSLCWNEGKTTKLAMDAFCGIEEVHNTMAANGDSAKPIWLTEFGWSTTTAQYGVSEADQAKFLTKALDKIRTSYPYVENAFYYNFRNNYWLKDTPNDFEANLGVLRVDFTAKPAYGALRSWAQGTPATTITPAPSTTLPTIPTPAITSPAPVGASGYWMATDAGTVFGFGDARSLGSGAGGTVDIQPTPTGKGYWLVDAAGTVRAFGDARHWGQLARGSLPGETITSLSRTPSGAGYWLFSSKGRVLPFGDAKHYGDAVGLQLNGPILDSIATPSGRGYYMVGSDGGVFAYGDARFSGSTGGLALNAPVQSLVPDPDGRGYWLVASDGGVFAFETKFRGSMGGRALNRPVTGMVAFGDGYLMVAEDGGIFNFSNTSFLGSLGASPPTSPVVAVASFG